MRQRVAAALGLCILSVVSAGCLTAIAAFQPQDIAGQTIVITTSDAAGNTYDRVVTPIDEDGRLFVAANHWPRAWYHRAVANPDVSVTRDGETREYRAVPVSEEERERLLDEPGFPKIAYLFTGFAPRRFLRLDPRESPSGGAGQ